MDTGVGEKRLPWVVRRNTLLFVGSEALIQCCISLIPSVATLVMLRITASIALVGLVTSATHLGRLVMSYLSGHLMDRLGRRRAILIGYICSIFGGLLIAFSTIRASFPLLMVSLFTFGLGAASAYQTRIVAADMFPPARKAEGIGYILMGRVVGTLVAPLLVATASGFAAAHALDVFALLWLLTPLLLIPGSILVFLVRPDPLEIARNLEAYYPRMAQQRISEDRSRQMTATHFGSLTALALFYPMLTAFVVSSISQGNMNMVMALAAVVMQAQGDALTAISLAVSIHIFGMYGLSYPLGLLADRFGRRRVISVSLLISAIAPYAMTVASDYWLLTLSFFLVGLGWSGSTIASTALVSDVTAAGERGRAIGLNDLAMSAAALIFPVIGSTLMAAHGFAIIGYVGILVTIAPLVMGLLLRERSPGVYAPSRLRKS